jgi:hypothetical protein
MLHWRIRNRHNATVRASFAIFVRKLLNPELLGWAAIALAALVLLAYRTGSTLAYGVHFCCAMTWDWLYRSKAHGKAAKVESKQKSRMPAATWVRGFAGIL